MEKNEIKVHVKSKHLGSEERFIINKLLNDDYTPSAIAESLEVPVSTITREIKKHRKLVINHRSQNVCGNKIVCYERNKCGACGCTRYCKECVAYNCNALCDKFTLEPNCEHLKKHGNVCNGCKHYTVCKLNKFIYDSQEADKEYKKTRSESNSGIRIDDIELKEFIEFIKPLLDRNQSLDVIKNNNPDKFPYSVQTVYKWIDKGLLKGIDNLMLPLKVRRKPSKKRKKYVLKERLYLTGRSYNDFLRYITEHPYDEIVEMDTVEGSNKDSYIMTLLFRKSNFMLAFKLEDHTSDSVIKIFENIKSVIGEVDFANTFKVILTDRGSEFSNPEAIENMGYSRTHVFYCDAMQSQQKGKIEKNHEELRKIFPKGFDFRKITQADLNYALNQINSYPRKILNYSSPYELAELYLPRSVLNLIDAIKISPNKVSLKPFKVRKIG